VLPLDGTTGVGYLNLRTYISTPTRSCATPSRGSAPGHRLVIVDLRYNGGGL